MTPLCAPPPPPPQIVRAVPPEDPWRCMRFQWTEEIDTRSGVAFDKGEDLSPERLSDQDRDMSRIFRPTNYMLEALPYMNRQHMTPGHWTQLRLNCLELSLQIRKEGPRKIVQWCRKKLNPPLNRTEISPPFTTTDISPHLHVSTTLYTHQKYEKIYTYEKVFTNSAF